ncbi:MAG TPA: SIMPL domain-containing protein, partial [Clostridiaceae bacterium]|nr:SIMPL domain-containing protein [Clostridiaceae bacterium]
GFAKEDLKTQSFSVNSRYDNEPDERGIYRQKLAGYEYDYRMSLTFPKDNERLGQVLSAMLRSGVPVEFNLNYTVSDPEPAKAELLKRAVEDSKKKAEGLAAASGVELGPLLQISYAWQDQVFRGEVMKSSRALGVAAFSDFMPELEAADIELQESVRVVWSIL